MTNLKFTANGIRFVDPPNTFPKLQSYLLVPLPQPTEKKAEFTFTPMPFQKGAA